MLLMFCTYALVHMVRYIHKKRTTNYKDNVCQTERIRPALLKYYQLNTESVIKLIYMYILSTGQHKYLIKLKEDFYHSSRYNFEAPILH